MYCGKSPSSFKVGLSSAPKNGVFRFWMHPKADATNLLSPISAKLNPSSRSYSESSGTSPYSDCHRQEKRKPLASGTGTTLGNPIQLLCQRCPLGPNVRAHVPVFSLLGSPLSQSAPLAGQPH